MGCFQIFSWELKVGGGGCGRQQSGLGRESQSRNDQGQVLNGATD
jgi:hypothetical protein